MESQRLVRTAGFDFDLKRSEGDADAMVMSGKLAVFNDWTEIKSRVEGHFMERIAPGAFAKTIRENGQRLKVLFQHGQDAAIGKKPLGRILRLEETGAGVEYDVELLRAQYVDDLLPGLEAGLYGSSFLAEDIKSDEVSKPKRSDHNPQRLPEVTRLEMRMHEFGPVTFPAYGDTTARMRSQTEEFVFPGIREIVALLRADTLPPPSWIKSFEVPALTKTDPEPEPLEESTPARDVSRSQAHDTAGEEDKPSWHLE